ncbi:NUDIX hydrolase [Paraburkholderia sp. A1RI-2L]|uniref:NUDIX hydrolase n=1 Tax=Paraburkholderia sp. A1RI-2L TaxID=3028367 RepID=UPI003BA0230F
MRENAGRKVRTRLLMKVTRQFSAMRNRATIVCRNDGRVLLVTRGRSRWSLPGGTVKRHEAPLHAAKRELLEETLIVGELLRYEFEFVGFSKRHHVFVLDVPVDTTPQPAHEIMHCRWVRPTMVGALAVSVPTREIVALLMEHAGANARARLL